MDQSQAPTDKPDIQPDGERYRQLKNGAIYDMDAKRIAANPGGGTGAITQANAPEYPQLYARKRLEAELAAGRGLASVAVSGKSELDAWSDIAANMAGGGAPSFSSCCP